MMDSISLPEKKNKILFLASACFVGVKCRYDGKCNTCPSLQRLFFKGLVLPVCPEKIGGLSVPRLPAEIQPDGRVINSSGLDVTESFIKGAKRTLHLAKLIKPVLIILKERSPSCGVNRIYDGSFSGRLIDGCGMTTRLLRKNGFKVISEEDWPCRIPGGVLR